MVFDEQGERVGYGSLDRGLLRSAAERCRDSKPGAELVDAMRHLQACFGWGSVLELLSLLDDAEATLAGISAVIEGRR